MLVKCKYCGEKKKRNNMFKIVIKNKNNYYCNETEYNKTIEEKERKEIEKELKKEMRKQELKEKQSNNKVREEVIEEMYNIIGRTTNTAIFKEVSEINRIHQYSKILSYLKSDKNELMNIMSKNFSNEYGKIRYFGTVIKNRIGDFKEEEPQEIKIIEDLDNYKGTYKNKGRKGFDDLF